MRILILAPHQDDEILGACTLIKRMLCANENVYIAYLTNGDYKGRDMAAIRYKESTAALNLLNMNCKRVFYFGYGDTGMKPQHSFLYRLYQMDDACLLLSKNAQQTYHPVGGSTLHYLCTKREASYNRLSFVQDLGFMLDISQPDIIVLPSPYDLHGDHQASFLFVNELLHKKERPILLTYLLHSESDDLWPNRDGSRFRQPISLSKTFWDSRFILDLSKEERKLKYSCIQLFKSQLYTPKGYLSAFAKKEEWFIQENGQPTITINPWAK